MSNKLSVEHNRHLLESVYKTLREGYGIDMFHRVFSRWDLVADELNSLPDVRLYENKTWTPTSARLLSCWYTPDGYRNHLVLRPRVPRGTGAVAQRAQAKRMKLMGRLSSKDKFFVDLLDLVFTTHQQAGTYAAAAKQLNGSSNAAAKLFRESRGPWSETKIYKLVRRCKRERPEIYEKYFPAKIKTQQELALDNFPAIQEKFIRESVPRTDATPSAGAPNYRRSPAPVSDVKLTSFPESGPTEWAEVPEAEPTPLVIRSRPAPRNVLTRVSVQRDGDTVQIIKTRHNRVIVSAKSTGQGGELVEAVNKLCRDFGIDVSKM